MVKSEPTRTPKKKKAAARVASLRSLYELAAEKQDELDMLVKACGQRVIACFNEAAQAHVNSIDTFDQHLQLPFSSLRSMVQTNHPNFSGRVILDAANDILLPKLRDAGYELFFKSPEYNAKDTPGMRMEADETLVVSCASWNMFCEDDVY